MTQAYVAPSLTASGITFAQWQADGGYGHVQAILAANASATSAPTTAATISVASYGNAMLPGTYLLNFTESPGFGETLPSTESAAFTLAVQSNPTTAATVSVSGSGGTLAAGTYHVAYTWVDAVTGGQTTIGTTESAAFTPTLGQTPVVTIPSLPAYASSANIYLTPAAGASGSETLYATGVTTTTYTLTTNTWNNGTTTAAAAAVVPASNTTSTNKATVTLPTMKTGNVSRNVYVTLPAGTTGTETLYAAGVTSSPFTMSYAIPSYSLSVPLPAVATNSITAACASKLKLFCGKNANRVWDEYRQLVANFNQGSPAAYNQQYAKMQNVGLVWAILQQMTSEATTLMLNNPGTIRPTTNPIGNGQPQRSWP